MLGFTLRTTQLMTPLTTPQSSLILVSKAASLVITFLIFCEVSRLNNKTFVQHFYGTSHSTPFSSQGSSVTRPLPGQQETS